MSNYPTGPPKVRPGSIRSPGPAASAFYLLAYSAFARLGPKLKDATHLSTVDHRSWHALIRPSMIEATVEGPHATSAAWSWVGSWYAHRPFGLATIEGCIHSMTRSIAKSSLPKLISHHQMTRGDSEVGSSIAGDGRLRRLTEGSRATIVTLSPLSQVPSSQWRIASYRVGRSETRGNRYLLHHVAQQMGAGTPLVVFAKAQRWFTRQYKLSGVGSLIASFPGPLPVSVASSSEVST